MNSPKRPIDTGYLPSDELQIFVLRCYLDELFEVSDQILKRTELEHVNNDTTSVHDSLDETFEHISKVVASAGSSPNH
ncbi:hypothetical protein N9W89_07755 [Hellea sp.]|nr:hypothetical protein [Hellea sp.]